MPRKKAAKRKPRRRMNGKGDLPRSLGENNINQLARIGVGENNLNAIAQLEMPKPPLQPLGQVVNISALPYRVTGSVPLLDRVRGALKRSQIISKTARKLGANRIADYASQYGYGKRKKHMRGGARYALIDKYGAFIPAN